MFIFAFVAVFLCSTLAAPSPPVTPTGFTASVYLSLNPDTILEELDEQAPFSRFWQTVHKLNPPALTLRNGTDLRKGGFRMPGQYYYNATTQKVRLDSAIVGGFVATFNLYGAVRQPE